MKDVHSSLRKAIAHHDVIAVHECLANGADPNYFQNFDTDEEHQPTTPLSLVAFCISDSLLKDDDLKQFGEIAELLLKHGADPTPAIKLAEMRYGKYDPKIKTPFMEVWHIIANAKK